MRQTLTSPFASGSIAAVIYAVIYLLTGGGADTGLVIGSVVVGAIATAITFIVHAIIVTSRARN